MKTNTVVSECCESKSEAIEMAKNLCALGHERIRVVFFPRAIPRRCRVVNDAGFAQYAGQDWAQVVFTAIYSTNPDGAL